MLPQGQPIVPFGQRPILNIQTISPDYTSVLRVRYCAGVISPIMTAPRRLGWRLSTKLSCAVTGLTTIPLANTSCWGSGPAGGSGGRIQ